MAEPFPSLLLNNPMAQDLPFLLIGGHAVIALGFIRATYDFDLLVPEPDRSRWQDLLKEMGYTLFAESGPFMPWTAPRGLPAVDVMVVDPATFAKLRATSRQVTVAGQILTIPSPENLVALKLHATRQRLHLPSVQKDWEDIVQIIRRHGLDLEEASFRALVVRYGGTDAPAILAARLA